jgi:uncharacterized protein YutD
MIYAVSIHILRGKVDGVKKTYSYFVETCRKAWAMEYCRYVCPWFTLRSLSIAHFRVITSYHTNSSMRVRSV